MLDVCFSLFFKGYGQVYCQRIVRWIKENEFEKTILLSSCLASERLDSQIQRLLKLLIFT